jgi:hypothetical protein
MGGSKLVLVIVHLSAHVGWSIGIAHSIGIVPSSYMAN